MEVAEQVYEEEIHSKITTIRADSNRTSHVRKRKGVKVNFPNISEKICTGKCKKNYAGHPSNGPTSDKNMIGVWPQIIQRGM